MFITYLIDTIRKRGRQKTLIAARMAELEQTALLARMNPHFIFNCLNAIQAYIIDRDVHSANEFIGHVSRLVRRTLEISDSSSISLETEIDYISAYMELEKKRFSDRFSYAVRVGQGVPLLQYSIPPLILQPYLENAILHGVCNRSDKEGHIEIRMEMEDDFLVCTIEDNGIGRKQATQCKTALGERHRSLGMALTAKRIDWLNATGQYPISVNVVDREDLAGRPLGTRVIVCFPVLAEA